MSALEMQGYKCTKAALSDSIRRVDPDATNFRRCGRLQRRVYNVAGPHHLWHVDGNHKLRNFHLVIHGVIDGFSRACISLLCADNNRATTALSGFMTQGVNVYGCPHRIRTDKGGENIEIARFVIGVRGEGDHNNPNLYL